MENFSDSIHVLLAGVSALLLPGLIHRYKISREVEKMPYYKRVATDEEFEKFKKNLNLYYNDVVIFVNDSTNLKKYPSYFSYCVRYKELMRAAVKRMQQDEWTYNGFKWASNPIGGYKRKFLEELDEKQRINADKLP